MRCSLPMRGDLLGASRRMRRTSPPTALTPITTTSDHGDPPAPANGDASGADGELADPMTPEAEPARPGPRPCPSDVAVGITRPRVEMARNRPTRTSASSDSATPEPPGRPRRRARRPARRPAAAAARCAGRCGESRRTRRRSRSSCAAKTRLYCCGRQPERVLQHERRRRRCSRTGCRPHAIDRDDVGEEPAAHAAPRRGRGRPRPRCGGIRRSAGQRLGQQPPADRRRAAARDDGQDEEHPAPGHDVGEQAAGHRCDHRRDRHDRAQRGEGPRRLASPGRRRPRSPAPTTMQAAVAKPVSTRSTSSVRDRSARARPARASTA